MRKYLLGSLAGVALPLWAGTATLTITLAESHDFPARSLTVLRFKSKLKD